MRALLAALLLCSVAACGGDDAIDTPDATPQLIVWDCPCVATCSGQPRTFSPPRVCIDEMLGQAAAEVDGARQCLDDMHKNGCGAPTCACTCTLTDPVQACSPAP